MLSTSRSLVARTIAGATLFTLALGSASVRAEEPQPIGPQEAPVQSPEPSAPTEAEYEREHIEVTTAMLSPRRNNALSPRRFVPVRGDGTALRGARFYEEVGRPDLAMIYKRRKGTQIGLYVSGATLFVTGIGVALAGVLRRPEHRGMQIGGAITGTAGLLMMASSRAYDYFMPAHSIDPAVAKNLIDEHNAEIRSRLGLGPSAKVRVGAQLSATSAGMSVSGRF